MLNKNVGEYTFTENEAMPSDGRLLQKANINVSDIKFKLSFDIIMETEAGKKFKANVVFDLPSEEIVSEGISMENIELEDIVFKRF